ncbi:MAG: UrcA family protein [Pseudomonadota bacterium]
MNMHKGKMMIAAILMGTSLGAMADESWTEVRVDQQVVRFGDLDLGTRAGVAALHQRLRLAASIVCDEGVGLNAYQAQLKCRSKALDQAMAALPAVVASYHTAWKANGAHWLSTQEKPVATQLASR